MNRENEPWPGQAGQEAPGEGGGAQAGSPPDPTRTRQPGQCGWWGTVIGLNGSQTGWGGLASGSWPQVPLPGMGKVQVRGQLLGTGSHSTVVVCLLPVFLTLLSLSSSLLGI